MKLKDFTDYRLEELLTHAIQGLLFDDRESAIEYFHDTMDMTIEELEYFGVELTEEEQEEFEWERTCPKCGKRYDGYPALSRRDNKTWICSECGLKEAFEDYFK